MRRFILSILALGSALVGASQTSQARETVVSDKSDDVNITIYQDPDRYDDGINIRWPGGYALITEKRTITIPAGESQIRFEGVSEGMLPESAIVSGLPNGVAEKNRDERLLSPFGLIDAFLKRRVTITRTSAVTGALTTKDVLITAGPSGGVIFESDEGYEALRCTGLPERISYDKIPDDLSAKPTLSVITQSDRTVTANVTLTYLAQGFDWQANYVANIDPDAPRKANGDKQMNLFAWLTVANGGNQSFDNANLMAVAGAPNREEVDNQIQPTQQSLDLRCWPQGRTDQVPLWGLSPKQDFDVYESESQLIVVTGHRALAFASRSLDAAAITAKQEDLGDLKLYRIPERVDVKAKGQKQVAMIAQPDAHYKRIYRASAAPYAFKDLAIPYVLRSQNDEDKGLGLPLPAGQFAVFENSKYGPLLVGEGNIEDRAIGNKVELQMPISPQVRMSHAIISQDKRKSSYRINVTNALNHPIDIEIGLDLDTQRGKNIRQIDGVPTWVMTVPANSEAKLEYRVSSPKA